MVANKSLSNLEPDILEYKVKWVFGSIITKKASGGDEIPAELFHILNDDAVKVLCSVCQQIWKAQQWPQDWKRSDFIPIPKKGNVKASSNYHTTALISHANKVMLKIFKLVFNSMWTENFQMYKLDLEKTKEPEIKIANIHWIIEKARKFQKSIYFCFIDYAKVFDCVDHNKLWEILRDKNTRPPYLSLEKPVFETRSNS